MSFLDIQLHHSLQQKISIATLQVRHCHLDKCNIYMSPGFYVHTYREKKV